MKPAPALLLTLVFTAFLGIPSPALSRPASEDYAVYSAKRFNVIGICFQGEYVWYGMGDTGGVLREDTRDGSFRYFGADDGISDLTIYTVFADSKNMIWLGTGHGVSRWDGAAWTNFSGDPPFHAMETFDIREDENGVLWFATWWGVRSFDGEHWKEWSNEQLSGITPRRIAIGHNGVKWFGGDRGLVRFDGTTWKTVVSGIVVRTVFEDSRGRVWLLYTNDAQEGHLALLSGDIMTTLPVKITFFQNPNGAIGEAPDGSIWCGTGSEFHVYDGNTWKTVPLESDLPFAIGCVARAPDGSLRFGGANNEVYRIENGKVKCTPLDTGPVWYEMLSAAVDPKGIKWFGSPRGLSRFDGTHWKTFYDRDGLAGNRINAIVPSGEIVWFGTDRGLSRYDGVSWKTFGIAEGLPDSSITCLAASRDGSAVWAGAMKGVVRFDGTSWKTFTVADGLPDDRINALFLNERDGTVYAGTNKGAASFNGSAWTVVTASPDTITAILADSAHRLWFGTNRGLLLLENSAWTLFNQGDGVSNLPDNTITALEEDSFGAVWAGTAHGSVRFDGSAWTVDLRLDWVHGIAADASGLTWFARSGFTDGSVIGRYASAGTNGPLKGTWTLRTNQYGVNTFAFAGGDTWAALPSWGGVARIDHESGAIRVFTTSDGLADNGVTGVASANGNTVWISAYSSWDNMSWIMKYDGESWSTFLTYQGQLDRIAADSEGGVWAIANKPHLYGAVYRWNVRTGERTGDFGDAHYQIIYINSRNTAWLSGPALINLPDSLWSSPSWYENCTKVDSPYSSNLNAIAEAPDGALWCGRNANPFGVARFDGVSWRTWTMADGLPTASINALAADKTGAVWAATNSGVARFDGEKWLTLTPENSGLRSEIVTTVAVAPDGSVWFGGWDWIASFKYNQPTPVEQAAACPALLRMESVFPNPFNASTVIRFSLPAACRFNLAVYDITGQKVRDLVTGSLPAGDHSVAWNGRDNSGRQVSSGVFFARLSTGKSALTCKMLLLK